MLNTYQKKTQVWSLDSSNKVPANQVWSPEFKPKHCQINNNSNNYNQAYKTQENMKEAQKKNVTDTIIW
jgi:hypothetical protein